VTNFYKEAQLMVGWKVEEDKYMTESGEHNIYFQSNVSTPKITHFSL